MNGELATMACLAAYGSLRLADRPVEEADLEAFALRFVARVQFDFGDGQTAADVWTWFHLLQQREVSRLWLVTPGARSVSRGDSTVAEHQLAGFANAGRWHVRDSLGSGSAWHDHWMVSHPNAADQRIWSVAFTAVPVTAPAPPSPSVAAARQQLDHALSDAQEFARSVGLEHWAELFEDARYGRGAEDAPTLLPADWPADARALMRMADDAWVFGGMGSWNDMGFAEPDRQQRYTDVSGVLYDWVCAAVMAAVNAPI